MNKKAAVITAAISVGATLLLAPKSGTETRRVIGKGIQWCLHAIGGNVKSGSRAVGQAGRSAGDRISSFARRHTRQGAGAALAQDE